MIVKVRDLLTDTEWVDLLLATHDCILPLCCGNVTLARAALKELLLVGYKSYLEEAIARIDMVLMSHAKWEYPELAVLQDKLKHLKLTGSFNGGNIT